MNATQANLFLKATHKTPISERIKVAWRNRNCWKIKLALRVISKAFKQDPSYRQSWHANIAMPIYDATRPKCWCAVRSDLPPSELHHAKCEVFEAETIPRRFECREMSIEQANYIAERIIRHIFQ